MPFGRLSIRSAVRLARSRVRCLLDGNVCEVHWSFPDGSPGAPPVYRFADAQAARAKARELRVFVALLALGVESQRALSLAVGVPPGRRQRELIGRFMERLALTSPKTLEQ